MDVPIVCPKCGRSNLSLAAGEAACPGCAALFTVENGVPDLVPELSFKRTFAQRFMEAAWVVSIYESRLWRKGPFFTLLAGVTFGKEFAAVIDSAALPPDGRLLDIACGPGIYTRPFARAVPRGRVVGLDLSRPMLNYAAKAAAREKLTNVSFVRASAMSLPFPAGSFDAINLSGALHLFPDPALALSEASRVLVEGGRLTVAAVSEGRGILPALQSAAAGLMGIRAFKPDELAVMFRAAGFTDVRPVLATARWMIMRGVKA